MNEREIYEANLKQVCKEIAEITEQAQKRGTMSDQDLDRMDKLYHTKKDILACRGMEYPEEFTDAGYSGRSSMTGRYVSRDNSYADGYSRGYSEAMSQAHGNNSGNGNMGNSGRPLQQPYYPYPERNW